MNEEVRLLMQKLGKAINDSLSDSERLAEAVIAIRAAGYEVFLVLEATIGFSERDDGQGKPTDPPNPKSPGLTELDRKFLRGLRIGDTESTE